MLWELPEGAADTAERHLLLSQIFTDSPPFAVCGGGCIMGLRKRMQEEVDMPGAESMQGLKVASSPCLG